MPEVFSLASGKERQSNEEKKTSGIQGNFLGLRKETK